MSIKIKNKIINRKKNLENKKRIKVVLNLIEISGAIIKRQTIIFMRKKDSIVLFQIFNKKSFN